MGVKIVKISDASFTGGDGAVVSGLHLYVVPVDSRSGAQPERIFLSADRLLEMGYEPKEGDTVYVFRNGNGRVIDLLKV